MTTDVHVRDLRYFLAVAEELHFTRAAERLYVSQPALSKQIRALERQLGVELLRRDPRGVLLTEAGQALLPHARQVLAAWAAADAAMATARAAGRGTLVVGMSTSPGRGGLLPAIRSRFTAAHPEAVVRLRQMSWQDPTAGLADGETEVAFVWLPLPDEERYGWTVVAEEPRLVALPDNHPLAAREEVDFADLADEPFLALPPSAGPLRDFWLALDERSGRPPRIGAEIAGTEETYEALVAGLGICLVAAGNAPLITLGGVVTRPVRGIGPSRYVLAWRKEDGGRALVRGVRGGVPGGGGGLRGRGSGAGACARVFCAWRPHPASAPGGGRVSGAPARGAPTQHRRRAATGSRHRGQAATSPRPPRRTATDAAAGAVSEEQAPFGNAVLRTGYSAGRLRARQPWQRGPPPCR